MSESENERKDLREDALLMMYGEVLKTMGYRQKTGEENVYLKPCRTGLLLVHLKNAHFCDVGFVIEDYEGKSQPRHFVDAVGMNVPINSFLGAEGAFMALTNMYYPPLKPAKFFTN